MQTNEFPIGELEEKTGVPRRTIYFYVQQGVLPPPSGAGLAARYQQAHLLRLRAIPRLRALGWRLDRIRVFFQGASDRQISAIVEGQPPREADLLAAPPAASASPKLEHPASTPFTRYTLAPGVDLFVERDIPPALADAVSQLLDAAATILGPAGSAARPALNQNGAARLETPSEIRPDSVDTRSTGDAH